MDEEIDTITEIILDTRGLSAYDMGSALARIPSRLREALRSSKYELGAVYRIKIERIKGEES